MVGRPSPRPRFSRIGGVSDNVTGPCLPQHEVNASDQRLEELGVGEFEAARLAVGLRLLLPRYYFW